MRKVKLLTGILALVFISQIALGQNLSQKFKMTGNGPINIELNQNFTSSNEIFPFEKDGLKIYGLAITGNIQLENDESLVRILLLDNQMNEYLIYESYSLLESVSSFSVDEICEETAVLDGVQASSIKIEILNARFTFIKLTYSSQQVPGMNMAQIRKEKKQGQNEEKINRLNQNLKREGKGWVAGPTEVSELSYAEKKQLFGQSTFPAGFEYYSGGVISTGTFLKSAASSLYVDNWDWRNRHGKNWITPVTNQGGCGSCWAFASTGATEAMANIYFNRQLNLDLSEQDVLSCSGAGDCVGGYPNIALNYIANTGVVDENTFPYTATFLPCGNKGTSPSQRIKISGLVNFGSTEYPQTEDDLKRMLIGMGPVSGGLYDWSHAMVLVGYQVVKEGDVFYYRDLNLARSWKTVVAGDPLIGKTVWIFKNSWGSFFGDAGYVYVETPITNIGWTHAIKTPVISEINNYQVVCDDNDGDGFYWWGLGEKPATCSGPDLPDGNDADPALGPLDQYGNYILLNAAPVANFTAGKTTIFEGESVSFNDVSANNPVSWSWVFEGGNPSVSTLKNPTVTYPVAGNYTVTLAVSNVNGTDAKTVENFIQTSEKAATYCTSNGSSAEEWISSVQIGNQNYSSGSSGYSGYQDFTGITFSADAGATQNLVLTPGFLKKTKTEYWRIWIDFNADKDFEDNGELVFTSNISSKAISGSIDLPAGLNLTTRMRISMKRGSIPLTCEIFSSGEVEDYTIQISEPVPLPPVADFIAENTNVQVGGNVQFNDLSVNGPESWQWNFPGGNPGTSTERNPVVTYNAAGEYDVTLVVSKAGFNPSQLFKSKYIATTENVITEYFTPVGINSLASYIRNITIGSELNNTTLGDGFSFSSAPVLLVAGQNYSLSLTPNDNSNRNFWRIWIDFNADGDFDDVGENLLTVNNKKGTFSGDISIPLNAGGSTRMRVAMRTGSAPAPCDENYIGEVEDYWISFTAAAFSLKSAAASTNKSVISGDVRIFPNPVEKILTIQLNVPAPGDNFTIYNVNGAKLHSEQIVKNRSTVDLSSYSPGVYFIEIINNNYVFSDKIVKR